MTCLLRLVPALVVIAIPAAEPVYAQPAAAIPQAAPDGDAASPGSAAPGATSATPSPPATAASGGDLKNPALAVMLSLGITLAGYGMTTAYDPITRPGKARKIVYDTGLVVSAIGPTTGHIYAGQIWSTGLGLRLLGGGFLLIGAADVKHPAYSDEIDIDGVGLVAFAAGALLYLGGSIWEISTAGSATSAYNRAHDTRAIGLSLTPIRGRAGNAPGLALVGGF